MLSVFFFAGGLRRPLHPGAPFDGGRGCSGGMLGGGVGECGKMFASSPRFSAERGIKSFTAGSASGKDKCVTAFFSPRTPLLVLSAMFGGAVRLRGCCGNFMAVKK